MTYTVRPISDRTQFTGKSTYSDFTVTWSTAEKLLLAELTRVRANNVVMELDLREGQVRNDGRPRADAKPSSRAVRVIFDTPDGATATFATDRFVGRYSNVGMREDWQHNVYAIAKGLEGLRMLKRYGISEHDQLYTGFKALPAGRAMPASHLTTDEAYAVIARVAFPNNPDPAITASLRDADTLATTVRRAKVMAHPDRRGGDHTLWNALAPALAAIGQA